MSVPADRDTIIRIHRGVSQEIAGIKQQLQGKRQVLNALERLLEKPDNTGTG